MVFIASCGKDNGPVNNGVGEDVKNAAESVKDEVADAVTPEAGEDKANSDDASVERSALIPKEMVQQIALEKAGLTADEVTFVRVELDRDDGRMIYEVEFDHKDTEYEADISATDGTILSWDKGKKD